jgi:hypothetical protein
MADAPLTFSESWYRIAQQRVALNPSSSGEALKPSFFGIFAPLLTLSGCPRRRQTAM